MRALVLLIVFSLAFGGDEQPLLATTSIIADIVSRIAGERFPVVSLIPGVDPHGVEPTSADLKLFLSATVIFTNGAGLEANFSAILDLPEIRTKVVDLSQGLPVRLVDGNPDPHLWLDPLLVAAWTERIAEVLSALDPAGAETFAARAQALREELFALDRWIRAEVEKIPAERRLLVTDHYALGYFAARYGLREVGAIVPSQSTLAEPSAKELAALAERIRQLQIPAIFITPTFSAELAERIAEESGAKVVVVNLVAPDYFSLMRELVRKISESLR